MKRVYVTILFFEEIRRDGERIHDLVNQSNKALHVSKGLPAWRDYVSYINDIVVQFDFVLQILVESKEESSETKIPWTDIRYIFGQIMYGGHIVNDHDRLLCMTYLEYILDDDIFEEKELCPFNADLKPVVTFVAPPPTTYERYLAHIDNELSGEPTELFGLHSNAEIEFRTTQSLNILRTIHSMSPKGRKDTNSNEDTQSPQHIAENMLNDILECIEISSEDESYFDMDEITSMMEGENRTPYQNVFMQECEQMNALISCILSSLKELERGFAGELNMTDSMEALMMSLYE